MTISGARMYPPSAMVEGTLFQQAMLLDDGMRDERPGGGNRPPSLLRPGITASLTREGNMAQPLMNSKQAAEYLKISHRTLYEFLERNEVPVAKVGGSLLFSPVALDEWAKKQMERSISA